MRPPCDVARCCLAQILIHAVLCAGAGLAQDEPVAPAVPPTTLVLDPDAAADLALRNSTQLRIDAQTLAQAEAQLKQAIAADNPRLQLSGVLLRRGRSICSRCA